MDSVGNRANSRVDKDNRAGYKGVTCYPTNKKWGVQLIHRGQKHWFGLHDSPKEAALVYNLAALRIVGETAWLNPIVYRPFYDASSPLPPDLFQPIKRKPSVSPFSLESWLVDN